MGEQGQKLVVVAGGTGGIGRHVVDGILATKKYTVKVFSRQDPSATSDLTAKGANVVKVDYSDHASLVKELQGVHTVIVCLISMDHSGIQSQINLLNACLEAKVKRFAPSEFSGDNGSNTVIELDRIIKTPVREKVKASGIEYTLFNTGIFMDYFASPQKASPSLHALTVGVDFNKGEANIVGTGDDPFCLTRGEDVGRFVAAALDLDKWEEKLGMVGSRTTWNELIKLGEQVRGKKFNVKRTSVDEALKGGDPNPSSPMTNFMSEVFVALCQGEFDVEPTLNQKFPEIVPTTIHEFINQWWGGKEGQTF
jgi:uncharacterized protein YbjT (DUF2867 family)